MRTLLIVATVLALAWGSLAFGAVYPWAYTPLAIGVAVIGLLDLIVTRGGRAPIAAMATGLTFIGLAISAQLIPFSPTTLDQISPATTEFLLSYNQSFGVIRPADPSSTDPATTDSQNGSHPLSISAPRTTVGIALFVSLALFFLGTSRLLSSEGSLALARPLVAFGILLSLIGIGQYTLTLHQAHPLIYGFWRPQSQAARPFGPYVNPNHFAGWMLMVLPIGLALFYEALERTSRAAAALWGGRLSVVRLPEFGQAVTFGFSSVVMGLSLAMTKSRSALAALAAGSLLALWIVLRRQRSMAARAAVTGALLIVVGGAAAWAGLDTLASKASADSATNDSLRGRLRAWRDTARIITDFPLTGTGFNTYGIAMTVYQTGPRDVHFQEAHNDYLQLAAEGGLLVGLPILTTLAIFVGAVRRRFREAPREGTTYWLRVGAVIGLVSIALQSLMDFSLQMPGNAALCAVLAAIAIHRSPKLRRKKTPKQPDTLSVIPGQADQPSGNTAGAI
jgi:O-antigen ligase